LGLVVHGRAGIVNLKVDVWRSDRSAIEKKSVPTADPPDRAAGSQKIRIKIGCGDKGKNEW
jgi:hypothetical protein